MTTEKRKLESLLEEDWFKVKAWGEYLMLEKGDERILYDEKKGEIAIKYKFDDGVRLCGSN